MVVGKMAMFGSNGSSLLLNLGGIGWMPFTGSEDGQF